MPRLVFVLLLLLGGIALLAGTVSYLSYGVERLPDRARVAGLTAPATVTIHPDGLPAQLHAEGEQDALRALGYAQAQEMGWQVLLWRQAARGKLAQWMGENALVLDRHATRLRLLPDSALSGLPDADRAALDAFAEGVTAGLQSAETRDRFVALLGIAPEPFSAEDVVAIERLFAWCATRLSVPDTVHLPEAGRAFVRTDSLFRRALGLFGWEHSAGWTYGDSTRHVTTLRWVTGHSALPVLHESVLYRSSDSTLYLTLPGTPFPLLRAGKSVQGFVPRAHARLQPAAARDWKASLRAIAARDGATHVLKSWHSPTSLLLNPDTTRAELWELVWEGFSTVTSASGWLGQWRGTGEAEDLALFQSVGIGSGVAAPPHPSVRAYGQGWVTGPVETVDWLQQRLDSLATEARVPATEWYRDARSEWAAATARAFTTPFDTSALQRPAHLAGFEYLSNWDGSFTNASIAGTVFEALAQLEGLDPLAGRTAWSDSTPYFAGTRHARGLMAAVDTVVAQYGPHPISWRWEKAHPERRLFPLWSVAEALDLSLPRVASIRAFTLPGEGRATTLRWLDPTPRQANATYVAVVTTGGPRAWQLYRLRFDPYRAFGRYLVADRRLQALPVDYAAHQGHLITLQPLSP